MIRAAVLGRPIDHSLSPLVHGLIYKELGMEYDYRRIDADEVQARERSNTVWLIVMRSGVVSH
jgi:shikimate 5-dehydrogenase